MYVLYKFSNYPKDMYLFIIYIIIFIYYSSVSCLWIDLAS